MALSKDQAVRLFASYVDIGWPVALKHRDGAFSVEIPTGLKGTPAYRQEDFIVKSISGMACKVMVTNAGTTKIE